jgi:hypothetical protein
LTDLPDLTGICIGTRPDCLDPEKISYLASLPWPEKWLELGLQSSNDQTLQRINRGHTAQCFAQAAQQASISGLLVCAHVIAGLPGEDLECFLRTIAFANSLPIRGIKIHNCYVARGSTLAAWWKQGKYNPLGFKDYVSWAARAVAMLRPDIVVHRLNADPSGDELLAPDWARNKHAVLEALHHELKQRKIIPDTRLQRQ